MKQKVWENDDTYVVLTHVENNPVEGEGRWELELTETVDVQFYHGVQQQDLTHIEYHRTWIGARVRAWRFMHNHQGGTVRNRTWTWTFRVRDKVKWEWSHQGGRRWMLYLGIALMTIWLVFTLASVAFASTLAQYDQVERRMTRHHVQQVVFDGDRGVWVGNYVDGQGDEHLMRRYKMTTGETVQIIYRKPVNGSHFRVQSKEVFNG